MLRNLWRSPVLIALTDVALHWSSLLSWLTSQGLALRISLHWSCWFCSQRMFIWMFNKHLIGKAIPPQSLLSIWGFWPRRMFWWAAFSWSQAMSLLIPPPSLEHWEWKPLCSTCGTLESLSDFDCLFKLILFQFHIWLLVGLQKFSNKQINKDLLNSNYMICNYLDPTSLYPYSTGRCSRTSVSQGEEGGKPWAVLLAEGAVGLMHLMSSCVGGAWREGLWLQTEVSLWTNMLLQSFRIVTFQMLWYRCPYLLPTLACT